MKSSRRSPLVISRVAAITETCARLRSIETMTTNIAEVLKFAAKPVQYDNDESTWLEFRFNFENNLTLVDDKYVQLLRDAASQPMANLPAGGEDPAVTIRTLSQNTIRLADDIDHWKEFETGAKSTEQKRVRGVETVGGRERAEKTPGRRFAMLQAVLQPGMSDNPRSSKRRGNRVNTRWLSAKLRQSWMMT